MTVPGCRRILKVDLVFPGQFKVSDGAKDLIAKVCTAQMSLAHMLALSLRRPSSKRCREASSDVQLLKKKPSDRLTLEGVLQHPWILQHAP